MAFVRPEKVGASAYGVPQDYAEAIKWYRMAAEQGVADAQSDLGTKYFIGQGVLQDFTDAERWWHMAAEQGFDSAQNNLGSMYGKGIGVPQDSITGSTLFSVRRRRLRRNRALLYAVTI